MGDIQVSVAPVVLGYPGTRQMALAFSAPFNPDPDAEGVRALSFATEDNSYALLAELFSNAPGASSAAVLAHNYGLGAKWHRCLGAATRHRLRRLWKYAGARLRRRRHKSQPRLCRLFQRQCGGHRHAVQGRRLLQDRPPAGPGQQIPLPLLRRVARHDEHLQRQCHHRRRGLRHRRPCPTGSRRSTRTSATNSRSSASSPRPLWPKRSRATSSASRPTSRRSRSPGRSPASATTPSPRPTASRWRRENRQREGPLSLPRGLRHGCQGQHLVQPRRPMHKRCWITPIWLTAHLRRRYANEHCTQIHLRLMACLLLGGETVLAQIRRLRTDLGRHRRRRRGDHGR